MVNLIPDRLRAAARALSGAQAPAEQPPTTQQGRPISWYLSAARTEWGQEAYDDLVAEKGVGVYREMLKRDDAVHSSVRLPILARLSKLPEYQPRSQEPDDVLAAALCNETFDRLEGGSLTRFLASTLTGVSMGFSVQEKVWGEPFMWQVPEDLLQEVNNTDEEAAGDESAIAQPITPLPSQRMVQLPRRFHLLPHETLTFKLDEWGEIERDGVWQLRHQYVTTTTQANPGFFTRLPRDRFVIWKWLEEEGWGNPFGLSTLRPAFRWYFLKEVAVRWWGQYLERFGKPLVKARVKDGLSGAQASAIDTLLNNFQTSNRYRMTDTIEALEIQEMSHTSTNAYEQLIKFCNRSIARCVFMPHLILEGGETTGSNALGQSHADTYTTLIDHLGTLIADEVMREQVAADIVRVNLGPNVRTPLVSMPAFADKDRSRFLAEMKLATEAGFVVPRAWAYEEAEIPIPGIGEELLDEAPEREPGPVVPEVGVGEQDVAEAPDAATADLLRDMAEANGGKDKDDVMAILNGQGRRSRHAWRSGF